MYQYTLDIRFQSLFINHPIKTKFLLCTNFKLQFSPQYNHIYLNILSTY